MSATLDYLRGAWCLFRGLGTLVRLEELFWKGIGHRKDHTT